MLSDLAAGGGDRLERAVDVRRLLQSEPEVRDPAALAGLVRLALEDDHVTRARRLHLHEIGGLVDRHHTEDRLIEGGRPLRIANGECDVRQAVRLHRCCGRHQR